MDERERQTIENYVRALSPFAVVMGIMFGLIGFPILPFLACFYFGGFAIYWIGRQIYYMALWAFAHEEYKNYKEAGVDPFHEATSLSPRNVKRKSDKVCPHCQYPLDKLEWNEDTQCQNCGVYWHQNHWYMFDHNSQQWFRMFQDY